MKDRAFKSLYSGAKTRVLGTHTGESSRAAPKPPTNDFGPPAPRRGSGPGEAPAARKGQRPLLPASPGGDRREGGKKPSSRRARASLPPTKGRRRLPARFPAASGAAKSPLAGSEGGRKFTRIAPKLTRTGPKVAPTSPKVARTAPTVTRTAPKVARTAPKVARSAPTVARTVPKVARTAPTVARTVPKVARTAPKVARTAPKVARSAPKVARSAPKVASTRPSLRFGPVRGKKKVVIEIDE